MDEETGALWQQALAMTGEVAGQALHLAGIGGTLKLDHCTRDVQATIAAAAIQACAQIFTGLVQANMTRQLREAWENGNVTDR